jgi:hypothetical protein
MVEMGFCAQCARCTAIPIMRRQQELKQLLVHAAAVDTARSPIVYTMCFRRRNDCHGKVISSER